MIGIVFEGVACADCVSVISSGVWDSVSDPDRLAAGILTNDLPEGAVVTGDVYAEVSSRPCDHCGQTLSGYRADLAVLAPIDEFAR